MGQAELVRTRLSARGQVDVVGEDLHQATLRDVAGGRVVEGPTPAPGVDPR